jgi:16S rRNA C1402 N4-methylase RsmH
MDRILKQGDTVVDATCGNGYDSIYIAEKIGKAGTLYCFDVQNIAIKKTEESLLQLNEAPTIHLLQESHENLELFVKEKVDCVYYNLGYLPNSDKSITTNSNSTIQSLKSAFNILKPNGIISMMCYLNHDDHNEYNQIKIFLLSLNQLEFSIAETNFILRKTSPILLVIEKQ